MGLDSETLLRQLFYHCIVVVVVVYTQELDRAQRASIEWEVGRAQEG